ncbi:DUF5663 domain-containing protein [Micromonospora sp. URMC 105]|uniref:DUF5663 domain-containing protein n=1 Tax=Micromonospora sp. URMC 105 TaxID=3423413 RepID=UPI003F19E942
MSNKHHVPPRWDYELLRELGLLLMAPDVASAFLDHMRETLELRVGEEIARALTNEEMSEFEDALEEGEEVALRWLGDHIPEYPDVASAHFQVLKEEITGMTSQIMSVPPSVARPNT